MPDCPCGYTGEHDGHRAHHQVWERGRQSADPALTAHRVDRLEADLAAIAAGFVAVVDATKAYPMLSEHQRRMFDHLARYHSSTHR